MTSISDMKHVYLICLWALVGVGELAAQDSLRLDFQQAVKIGLQNNVSYQSLNNLQEVRQLERQAATLGHLPRLNMNNNFYRQSGQQYQQVEDQIIVTNLTNNSISSSINANLPIFNGGRRLNMSKATRSFVEAGKNEIERASQQVVFDIAQQYLQVLLDQELFKIAEENLENQKRQLEQISGFVEAGLRTLSDQYNQQSEVARLEVVALNARIQWETDAWILAETLQLDPNTLPVLEPVSLQTEKSAYLSMEMESLYQLAMLQRKDFKQQEELVAGTKRMLNVSRSFMYPQLNAFFNYSTFFTSFDDRRISQQLFQIYPQRTLGFSISIPIFNNFDNRIPVARSKMEHKNQLLERSALERRVLQEVKLAYENYLAAIKREEATKTQLTAAVEAQTAIAERFRLGVSNFVDLATANRQLVTGQSDYAQALYTLYFQEVMLSYALGVLAPEI
jgi:outer membrane protein